MSLRRSSLTSQTDVFGSPRGGKDLLTDLEFYHPNIDPEVLSNTSIASFHEFPPQSSLSHSYEQRPYEEHVVKDDHYENEHEKRERSVDLSYSRHSNISLDASIASIVNDLKQSQHSDSTGEAMDHNRERTQTNGTDSTAMEVGRGEEQQIGSPISRLASPLLNRSQNSFEEFLPTLHDHSRSPPGLYEVEEGRGSRSSLMGSDAGRDRSPRISRDDIKQRLAKQRSAESMSYIGSPPVSLMPQAEGSDIDAGSSGGRPLPIEPREPFEEMDEVKLSVTPPLPSSLPPTRPSLEERLKRALSPAISAPAPLRPTPPLSVSSPKLSSVLPSLSTSPLPSPIPIMVEGRHNFDTATTHASQRPEMHTRAHTIDVGTRSPLAPSFNFDKPGVDIAEMDMRSALDRLVDDVSSVGGAEGRKPDIIGLPELDRSALAMSSGEVSLAETELITEESTELLANLRESLRGHGRTASAPASQPMQRASTAPELYMSSESPMHTIHAPRIDTELAASPRIEVEDASPIPPPVPPKTPQKSARQAREEIIKEKRRVARGRESGEYFVPPRRDVSGNLLEESPASKRYSASRRPSTRRSMSMGEIEDYMDSVSVYRLLVACSAQSLRIIGWRDSQTHFCHEEQAWRCFGHDT